VSESSFLTQLENVIAERMATASKDSYTARLAASGPLGAAQKVGEEGVETALAGVGEEPERLVSEAADLLYHLLVLLRLRDVSLADVVAELERRHTN
jgi:phosphoribosyl-ATP pyrophosphohydrolase